MDSDEDDTVFNSTSLVTTTVEAWCCLILRKDDGGNKKKKKKRFWYIYSNLVCPHKHLTHFSWQISLSGLWQLLSTYVALKTSEHIVRLSLLLKACLDVREPPLSMLEQNWFWLKLRTCNQGLHGSVASASVLRGHTGRARLLSPRASADERPLWPECHLHLAAAVCFEVSTAWVSTI